jgi:hypothetical protein
MGAEGLKEPRELIVVSGFGAGQAGWAQARLPEPMAALRFTLPLIGPGATAAASRLGIEIKTRRGCCSLLRGVRIAWGNREALATRPTGSSSKHRSVAGVEANFSFLGFSLLCHASGPTFITHTRIRTRFTVHTHTYTHARYSRSFLYRSFFA